MKTKLTTLLALAWTMLASAQSQYAGIYSGSVDDTTFNDPNAGAFSVFIGANGLATVVGYDVDSFQYYNDNNGGQASGVAAQFNVPGNGNWNFSSNNTIYGVSGSGSITNGSFSGTLNFTNGDTVQLNGSQQSPLGNFQNAAGFYSGTFSGNFGGPMSGPLIGVLSTSGQITFSVFINGALNDGGQGQIGSNNQFITTNFTSGTVVSGTLTNATLKIGGTVANAHGSGSFTISRSNYAFGVATTNLPPGTTTVPYSQTLTAFGGPTNYSWGIISGGLPAGLSLSRSGVISGTPTAAVTANFTVQATNAASLTATQALSLVIYAFSTSQTFTISPATVSNTYPGQITLQVSGLVAGSTVAVQKFLDINTNGVIDAGDLLVQQFNLTDGQAGMVIGGVTNFNVPGDTDGAANGHITAKLNFQGGDVMQNVVGKYLFKVSGNFTPPITNSFTVTNFPWGQKFTGNVTSNGVAVPYAGVLLFVPNQSPIAGAIANNSGNYTIAAPPGTYSMVAFKSNFVANMSAAPVLTLAASQTITNNPALTNATTSISGTVVDASNSSIGLPGLLIAAEAKASGLLAVAFTDTNGNFNVPVTAGNWKIGGNESSLIAYGYLGLKTNVNAGVTGVIIAVPKATALIYGSVKDNLGNPFAGLDVYANDQNNLYQTDAYTDANGNYVLGVLGLGSSDQWGMDANNNNQITNYIFPQPQLPNNGSIASGAAVLQNFTAILATNYITGNVKFNGTNIVGVGVNANATINSVNYSQYVDTDANGNYSLTVASGTWGVSVNDNGGSDSLDSILGNGNYQCPGTNVTILNNNGTVNFTVEPMQPLQMTTTSLPDGAVDVYYDQSLSASGGQTPYDWWLPDGTMTLPPGTSGDMNFSNDGNNGIISGTPGTAGTFSFRVGVTDNASPPNVVTQMFSITIQPSASPLQITTTYLPTGTNSAFYSQTLQASGGQPPYSWSIPDYSADPPPNLTLAASGALSGTLATSGGPFYFDVEVTDGAANTVDQTLSVYIVNPPLPPLLITNVSLPGGTVGAAYSAQLGATGGQSPDTWALAAGSANPPAGLTLDASGLISGTPTTSKISTFKVQVTDATFVTTTNKVLSITINPRPVLGLPMWVTNRFQMRLTGASNQNYTVQMSTNLSATTWTSLFVTNSPATNAFLLIDPGATNQQRFYRILIGP